MIYSKILLSILIVLIIGVAAAGYQTSNQSPGLWNSTATQNPDAGQQIISSGGSSGNGQESSSSGIGTSSSGTGNSSSQSQSGLGSVKVNVTSTEAKTIAQKRILEPSASAGTPELKLISGKPAYVVPVVDNGKVVGEFVVDAKTGAIIEGAGGAP
jgi:Peptidase propeptide and YPEB domain